MNVFVGGLSMHCYLDDVLDKCSAGCFECWMDLSVPDNLGRWLNLEICDVEEMAKASAIEAFVGSVTEINIYPMKTGNQRCALKKMPIKLILNSSQSKRSSVHGCIIPVRLFNKWHLALSTDRLWQKSNFQSINLLKWWDSTRRGHTHVNESEIQWKVFQSRHYSGLVLHKCRWKRSCSVNYLCEPNSNHIKYLINIGPNMIWHI